MTTIVVMVIHNILSRTIIRGGPGYKILIAQLAEHSADNGEVGGSSPSQNIGNEQLQDVRVSLMIATIVLAKQSERL